MRIKNFTLNQQRKLFSMLRAKKYSYKEIAKALNKEYTTIFILIKRMDKEDCIAKYKHT